MTNSGDNDGRRRFIPSLLPWKATLLALDFYKDITDDKNAKKQLDEIPLHFADEDNYINILLPLYWEEAKMQIHRAKFQDMTREFEVCSHKSFKFQDDFIKMEFQRSRESCSITFLGNCDLILLSQGDDPLVEHPDSFLALVDNSFGHEIVVTAKLDLESSEEGSKAKRLATLIANRSDWNMAKIGSMMTIIREYEGLMSLPYIPLRNLILNREDAKTVDTSCEMQAAPVMPGMADLNDTVAGADTKVAPAVPDSPQLLHIPPLIDSWLQTKYNASQGKAITESRKVSGITLVQGPPGTGKTTTILGILAVLLNSSAKAAKSISYTRAGNKTTGDCKDHEDNGDDDDDDDDDDSMSVSSGRGCNEDKEDETIRKRRAENIRLIRSRVPWFKNGYVPWADALEQDLPGPSDPQCRKPYPKLGPQEVVSMSEVTEDVAPRKVLVCAPSNAAIDEVIRRIMKDGIIEADGSPKRPSLIRLGPGVHQSLAEHSLEKIVKKRLAAGTNMPDMNQAEVEKVRLLRDARIVCTTLSITGSRDVVGFPGDFDTIVVDEASQGVELSMLVPLKLGCRRLILVGDPQQLPATCFSTVAIEHNYERSLFQRLQMSQHKVNMLEMQYRMHPAISSFPSQTFYDGKLSNALEQLAFEQRFPTEWSKIPCFHPVAFFHLKGEMHKTSQSFVNEDEADFIIGFFKLISDLYPNEDWHTKLAVISPYAEQVQLIRHKFRALFRLAPKQPCPVDVNTVDGFQGREKDCIIVSVVRAASDRKSIGFVRDRRRMNVAFTRARLNLWVVGHAYVLKTNQDWDAFISKLQKEGRFLKVTQPFDTFAGRCVNTWYDGHPELQKPKSQYLSDEGVVGEGEEPEFTISPQELEELQRKEKEEEKYARDVEFAPDSDADDNDHDGDDVGKTDVERSGLDEGLASRQDEVSAGKEGGEDDAAMHD